VERSSIIGLRPLLPKEQRTPRPVGLLRLISRTGILPISHCQDTAGPMTRTVRDAAMLLNVLAAEDPLDPATQRLQRPADYTADLAHDAMKGARIGVPSDPADPLNDCYYGKLPRKSAKVMDDAIKVLADLGAVIVRANMPTAGWIGGPGTTMAVLNRNPLSRNKGNPATPPIIFLYELKRDLNLYLKEWATNIRIKTIADIVAFNEANADKALRFGQDLFVAANSRAGAPTHRNAGGRLHLGAHRRVEGRADGSRQGPLLASTMCMVTLGSGSLIATMAMRTLPWMAKQHRTLRGARVVRGGSRYNDPRVPPLRLTRRGSPPIIDTLALVFGWPER
jgi:hypothetical protein